MEWNEIEKILNRDDFEAFEKSGLSFRKIASRTQKTFYYASGKDPLKDTLSYSLTKEAVESFRRFVPSNSGKIGPYYAARVSRNACISPCSLLIALIYVDRILKSNPSYLHSASSSEIFLVSMLVASKFMFDEGTDDEVYNDEWSASSHLDVKQVKALESQFLKALDWRAFVSPLEFQQMLQMMEIKLALRAGLSRGWFSYTDMSCLLQMRQISLNFNNVCFAFAQAFGLIMIVYVGILSACVGSLLIKPNVARSNHLVDIQFATITSQETNDSQLVYNNNYSDNNDTDTTIVLTEENERGAERIEEVIFSACSSCGAADQSIKLPSSHQAHFDNRTINTDILTDSSIFKQRHHKNTHFTTSHVGLKRYDLMVT